MKRAIINEVSQMNDKLQGYVYMMYFGFVNLCVKAEPSALIPIKMTIDGESLKIEDVANVALQGDYQMMVIPKYEDDLPTIRKSIAKTHPEFKQEHKALDVEMDDGSHKGAPYVLLTMPEVDDNRYDVLTQAANVLYDTCKAKMGRVIAESDRKIAELTVGEKKEDIDIIKKAVEEQRDVWVKHREKLHNDKIEEIEEGHRHWETQKAEKDNEQSSNDSSVATSMRFT